MSRQSEITTGISEMAPVVFILRHPAEDILQSGLSSFSLFLSVTYQVVDQNGVIQQFCHLRAVFSPISAPRVIPIQRASS